MRIFSHARGEGLDDLPKLPASELAAGTPLQFGRTYFNAPKLGLTVGMWSSSAFEGSMKMRDADEFGLLLDGSATITEAGGRVTELSAGDGFVIPRGVECAWKQGGHVRKIFVTYVSPKTPAKPPGNSGGQHVVKVETGARLSPCGGPDKSLLNGPEPRCAENIAYTDASGQFTVGLWSATPYDRKATPFGRYELMHFVEGHVDLHDGGQDSQGFGAGETVFVPKGAPLGWRSHRDLKKIFVILNSDG
jgi:hypothetical protein